MTDRQTLQQQYDTDDHGRICTPGKFEGEPIWVPYFWEIWLDGGADDDDGYYIGFDLTPDDVREWPELEACSRVELWQDDSGFVYADTTTI